MVTLTTQHHSLDPCNTSSGAVHVSIDILQFSRIQSSSFLKKFVSFIPSIHMVVPMLDGSGISTIQSSSLPKSLLASNPDIVTDLGGFYTLVPIREF